MVLGRNAGYAGTKRMEIQNRTSKIGGYFRDIWKEKLIKLNSLNLFFSQ